MSFLQRTEKNPWIGKSFNCDEREICRKGMLLKQKLIKRTEMVAAAFAVIAAVSALYYFKNPQEGMELAKLYMPTLKSVVDEGGKLSFVRVMLNNLFACATCAGMGLIPLLYLPALALLSNALMIGALLGAGTAFGIFNPFKTIVFGLMPHGIFELTAFFLSMAMGLYLCRILNGKLLRTGDGEKLLPALNGIAKIFVLAVIPLIAAAAAVECYITPYFTELGGLS